MSTVGRRAGAAGGARRELTPTTLARITGALYLLVIALGLFCELGVRGRLIVAGDVDATARNIHAYESLWRISIGAEVLLLLAATAMVPLMFVLFRPVNRLLTLAATAFDLVSLAVEASIAMFLLAALFPLRDAPYLREVDPHVTHAMMRVALSLHAHGFGLALAGERDDRTDRRA
ncbi:MAG: DUF4386 domain-containing protein [Deltaproteobacteria bacterium]|nr:DUF4386 domain-containing protein [Deltaproteobacteria bacterium]